MVGVTAHQGRAGTLRVEITRLDVFLANELRRGRGNCVTGRRAELRCEGDGIGGRDGCGASDGRTVHERSVRSTVASNEPGTHGSAGISRSVWAVTSAILRLE